MSNTVLSQSYQKQLESGIEDFYSGNWQQAENVFDSLIKEESKQPEAYFFRSMIPFWKYFFGGESKDDAQHFLKWSAKAIQVTENHLRRNSKDTSAVLFLSGLHGYRALVAADQEEYSIAIKSGMTGFNYTRKILSMNDDNPDAKIGRGIYYYMTGSIPSQVKWMAGALGFDGDKQWGFDELEIAAQSDSRVSIDANLILSYLYLKESKPELALQSATRLVHKYDSNSIFRFYQARAHEELGNWEDALGAYKQVIQINDRQLESLTSDAQKRLTELQPKLDGTMGSK
jgi:tetratricopeptide (TPR) repeat protein